MPESIGDRIYEIRRLLGPDSRTELPLREFAKRLTEISGRNFYDGELSKMERGTRGYSIADLETIAKLDPKQRGPWWIAWGVEVSGEVRGDESPPKPKELPPADFVPRPIPRPATSERPDKGRRRG